MFTQISSLEKGREAKGKKRYLSLIWILIKLETWASKERHVSQFYCEKFFHVNLSFICNYMDEEYGWIIHIKANLSMIDGCKAELGKVNLGVRLGK